MRRLSENGLILVVLFVALIILIITFMVLLNSVKTIAKPNTGVPGVSSPYQTPFIISHQYIQSTPDIKERQV